MFEAYTDWYLARCCQCLPTNYFSPLCFVKQLLACLISFLFKWVFDVAVLYGCFHRWYSSSFIAVKFMDDRTRRIIRLLSLAMLALSPGPPPDVPHRQKVGGRLRQTYKLPTHSPHVNGIVGGVIFHIIDSITYSLAALRRGDSTTLSKQHQA